MCNQSRFTSVEKEMGKEQGYVHHGLKSTVLGRSSTRKVFPVKEETIREAVQVMKDRKRAIHNLKIFRRVTLAIGKFYLAKLNCRRAKELCAAEVKRGLRKYRAKTDNYAIPVSSSKAIDGHSQVNAEARYIEYARFSPAMAHRRLYTIWQKNRDTVLRPDLEHFQTILFFADISGFTRLSERLSAEQLKTHTNNYFNSLIDVVAQFGGDIIKFCGDAVMIIWPCDLNAPNSIQTANAIQATKCALVMLRDCGDYNDGRGDRSVSLRLHCGIGAGSMYGYMVGYDDRWEYLVAGDPLRQVGEAGPEAAQGQVVVSPEVWSLISHSFVATKTPKGNYLLRGLGPSKSSDGLSGTLYSTVPRMPSMSNTWGGSGISPKVSTASLMSPNSPDRKLSSPKSAPNSPVSGNGSSFKHSCGSGSEVKRSLSPTNRLRRLNTGPSELNPSNDLVSESSKVVAGGFTPLLVYQRKHSKRRGSELSLRTNDSELHVNVASALALGASGISSPSLNNDKLSGASLQWADREAFGVNDSGCSSPTDETTCSYFNEQQSSGPLSSSTSRIGSCISALNIEGSNERGFGTMSAMADVLEVEEEGSTTDEEEEEPERIERHSTGNSARRTQFEMDPDPTWQQASKYLGIWLDAQYRGRARKRILAPLSGVLCGFCQESARYAIESNTVGYLAELRKVITIFINIVGLDKALLQGELVTIQQVMELGIRCMGCFGGVVRQFVVDDKGCVMIAAFGLPQYSFEDNEVRAISAAHDMLNALRGIDLKGSIGITAGTVYCGYVGTERRCEYAMMGTSVNLSARLMSAAPLDTICVDGEVFARAQKYFHFDHLPPIKAKGYSSTVPVFRPTPLVAESMMGAVEDDSTTFMSTEKLNIGNNAFSYTVGQRVEVSILSAVAKRLVSGGGKVVLLNGQAGSGKTHLLQSPRIANLGASLGFKMVTSFCSGLYTTTPYFAWRAILSNIFSLPSANLSLFPESDDTLGELGGSGGPASSTNVTLPFNKVLLKERSEPLRSSGDSSMETDALVRLSLTAAGMSLDASIGEGGEGSSARDSAILWKAKQWVRKYIPSMTGLTSLLDLVLGCGDVGLQNFGESTSNVHKLDPEIMYHNLDELIVEILRAFIKEAGGQPLMLVCENAQWIDGQSMKLLLKVACAVDLRVLIVLSSRPLEEYYEVVPQELIALHEMGVVIEMQPLCAMDCLKLSRWTVGCLVTKENPTLLPEKCGAILLKKSGGNPLFIRNIANTLKDEWERLGSVMKLEDLPESFFHDLIVSRFDSLEPAYQAVLKAASVIGPIFTLSLLLHMMPGKSRDKYENLHTALLHLIEANFISRTVVGKAEHFCFVHGGVHETIYKMMLTAQRQGLHEVCASWYEKHYTHSMTYSSIITHHWLRSANTIKKVECLVLAAANAKKVCLNQEVIKHYSALVSLAFGIEAPTSSICSLSRYWKYRAENKEKAPMRRAQRCLSILSTKMRLPWKWLRDNASGKTKSSSKMETKKSKSSLYNVTHVTKEESSMLMAIENNWLNAGDFVLCPDLVTSASEPNAIFSLNTVGCWIGEVGLAYYKLGRLKPAYNHMQEALLYLDFESLPSNTSFIWPKKLLKRIINRYSRRFRDQCIKERDVHMAARLYTEIADICLKTGQAHRIDSIRFLVNFCSRWSENYETSVENGRLLALFSAGDMSLGRHKVALAELAKAKKIAVDNNDCGVLKGDVFFASGIYHSALGLWDETESDFCSAFDHFAALGDSFRCCVVMIESAYVKICQGDLVEADAMFQEVKDMAQSEDNQYLILTSLYGKSLTETMMGLNKKAMSTAKQCDSILKGKRSIYLESIKINLDVAEGRFEDALEKSSFLILKLRKTKQMWFSLGFYLHLVSDALSTALEYNFLKDRPQQYPALRAWKAIMRLMTDMSRSFDMITPLCFLASARWYMLHGKEKHAKAAINLGLRSEEITHMPYAIGLLLLHSSRLCCLGDKDRRARAKKGWSILQEMDVSLFSPTKDFSSKSLKHLRDNGNDIYRSPS